MKNQPQPQARCEEDDGGGECHQLIGLGSMKTIAPEAPTSHTSARCSAAVRGAELTDAEKSRLSPHTPLHTRKTYATLQNTNTRRHRRLDRAIQ